MAVTYNSCDPNVVYFFSLTSTFFFLTFFYFYLFNLCSVNIILLNNTCKYHRLVFATEYVLGEIQKFISKIPEIMSSEPGQP